MHDGLRQDYQQDVAVKLHGFDKMLAGRVAVAAVVALLVPFLPWSWSS